MTQQVFKVKIRLPNEWRLNPETLKRMIEAKTIFEVLEIEVAKP